MVIAIAAATAIEALIPFFFKQFFDTLASAPRAISSVTELTGIVIQIFVLWGGVWLGYRIVGFLGASFYPRMITDLTHACFAHLHRHSFSFFLNRFVGSLVRRVNRFADAFEIIAERMLNDLFPMILRVIIALVILWYWNAILGILLAGWLVIFLSANYLFASYKLKYDTAAAAADSEVTAQLADTITNNTNIKVFTALKEEQGWFGRLTQKQFRAWRFAARLSASIEATQGALLISLEFVTFFVAIRLWNQGLLTLGDFALIQGYLAQIFRRLWDFWRVIRDIYRRLADAEEMTEILTTPHEVQDKPRAGELAVREGRMEFRDVTFTYTKTREVIKDFTLAIRPGEKVGLVGPSGAGKSTLVSLIFRFFDVQDGGIFIDGQNIADVTQESLRRNIGVVQQDPVLFHRTVLENIRYGRRDATDSEVFAAARNAHCDEFITRLAQGYDTYVGERGIKLSGGERQRVAIARAFLKNAPLLVLDEATSSLDSHSEGLIQDALARLWEGKTTIVIAHRLSTIMKMDRIIVVREGQIYESGTHKELLEKPDGLYKKLWNLQAGGFIA